MCLNRDEHYIAPKKSFIRSLLPTRFQRILAVVLIGMTLACWMTVIIAREVIK